MSKIKILKASTRKRSGSGALTQFRKEGLIPAVVYGKKQKSFNVKVDRKQIRDLLMHSASEQILVTLEIEDLKESKLALIQDVQHDHLTGAILHMDFHAVQEDEIIHASVPIELVGEAAGVKQGGMLVFMTHTLAIHCLPMDLPEKVSVDISELALEQAIHLRDLTMPKGVKAIGEGDVVIALVAEPKVAEPTPAAAAAAAAAPAKGAPAAAAAPAKGAPAAKAPAKPAAKK